MSLGKWIAGGLGWAFGGPIGGLVGFAIGSLFDSAATMTLNDQGRIPGGNQSQSSSRYKATMPGDFAASLLVLTAAVMKADSKVMKSELDYVKAFFGRQFGENSSAEILKTLKELLEKDIPVVEVCQQIKHNLDLSSRLQLIHYLFGVSNADGHVHPMEVEIIAKIAHHLGINTADFGSIKAMFYKDSGAAYSILEIEKTATDEELKKAYRRMAVKYHPDKINHLGEEFQLAAKEKFQQVQGAYETIKKERGLV